MERVPSVIHNSWYSHLVSLFQEENLILLNKVILPNCGLFHPKAEDIFNVFKMPLEEIRIVILGQDPYPGLNQAIGYAFAVNKDVPKPFSLRAIEKELGYEIDRTLSHWVSQGVFLLNTSLTVKHGSPNSHTFYWHKFTSEVIRIISGSVNPIWLLWGLNAQKHEKSITSTSKNPVILKAPHPASELYSGGRSGFYGCAHFTRVNTILKQKNQPLINW